MMKELKINFLRSTFSCAGTGCVAALREGRNVVALEKDAMILEHIELRLSKKEGRCTTMRGRWRRGWRGRRGWSDSLKWCWAEYY